MLPEVTVIGEDWIGQDGSDFPYRSSSVIRQTTQGSTTSDDDRYDLPDKENGSYECLLRVEIISN